MGLIKSDAWSDAPWGTKNGDVSPARLDASCEVRTWFLDEADYYWQLGYRGPLSADSVIDEQGNVTFTEVNGQFTGSTHLYRVLVARIARENRQATQMTSPEHWQVPSTEAFIKAVERSGCAFDSATRRGVIVVTPRIGGEALGPIVFAVIHEPNNGIESVLSRLESALELP